MTFGSMRAATPGMTDVAISATARSMGRLMRTTTSAPPSATRGTAAGRAARAAALCAGRIESSRSRMMASAPRVWAFDTKRSDVTGTNSSDRQVGWGRVI